MKRTDVAAEIAYVLALLNVDADKPKQRTPRSVAWLLAERLGVADEVTNGKIARRESEIRARREAKNG